MFIYIFLLAIGFIANIEAMDPVVSLKDDQNNIVIVTDAKTLQELQSLSATLKQRPLEEVIEENQKKLVVLTGLPKHLINFLLQLNANKDINKIYPAMQSGAISFAGITQDDINMLGLPSNLQKAFNALLIVKTEDGAHLPLQKENLIYFFDTIADYHKEFPEQILLSLQVNSKPMTILYNIVKKLDKPETLSLAEWTNLKDILKNSLAILKPTNQQLLALFNTANFLQAKSFLIIALYELYKQSFSEDAWKQELTQHPFLKNIPVLVESDYPSIEQLLKQGKKDFYSVRPDRDDNNKKILALYVQGNKVHDLKGLHLIPEIKQCQSVYIENTNIITIKKDDFIQLHDVIELKISHNKNLRTLEPGSFSLFGLKSLYLEDNDINIINAGVFILPNLVQLWFQTNHIHILKTDWAKNLINLRKMSIQEPELQILEPGWLHGLDKLNFINISSRIETSLRNQIETDIQSINPPPNIIMSRQ